MQNTPRTDYRHDRSRPPMRNVMSAIAQRINRDLLAARDRGDLITAITLRDQLRALADERIAQLRGAAR